MVATVYYTLVDITTFTDINHIQKEISWIIMFFTTVTFNSV